MRQEIFEYFDTREEAEAREAAILRGKPPQGYNTITRIAFAEHLGKGFYLIGSYFDCCD